MEMIRTRNVFLVGLPGVGKTTIGKQLAEALKLRFCDSDRELENRCGTDINWIYDLEGEEGFRKREQKVVQDLTELQGIVLATGGGCVLTKENRVRLSARGIVVYLENDPTELVDRIGNDQRRPQLREQTTRLETLKLMATELEPLYREIADITVNSVNRSMRSLVSEITTLFNKD